MKRNLLIGASVVTLVALLGIGSTMLQNGAVVEAADKVMAPRFEVDPMWPKPLPNHWVMGNTIGVSVDANDHIWIIHRAGSLEAKEVYMTTTPPSSECCQPAPPVLEFDEAGNLLNAWGGPGEGYDWPDSNHGITVDYKGNVWIGGNGAGRPAGLAPNTPAPRGFYNDNMILKFTQQGKFLMQIGKPGQSKGSNDVENLKGPAKLTIDPKTNELFVADGYGNKRVIVFDADTGKYKRHWGAYGNKPDDEAAAALGAYDPNAPIDPQFRSPVHCAELSNDNLLYVCDRPNDRLQIFKPDGTFVKEKQFYKNTKGDGSVWDLVFSKDKEQKFIIMVDGSNEKVRVLDRQSLEELTNFGDGGRQPGQFYAVHSIATDSKGNIFTTETYRGQRVQKFLYKGLSPVTKKEQGVVWPSKK